MRVKPNLVVVDIDGTVNRMHAEGLSSRDSGWSDDVIRRLTRARSVKAPAQVHIHRDLILLLAEINRRGDTEVVWLSWWPRRQVERLNRALGLAFRILPMEERREEGKWASLRVELLRADREKVVWLDDEGGVDTDLAALADLLVIQPDFLVGLTPMHIWAVIAFLDGADGRELVGAILEREQWRTDDRWRPKHGYMSRADVPARSDPGFAFRRVFLDELTTLLKRAQIRVSGSGEYGKRDGARIEPSQLEDAVRLWVEHGLRVEFRPMRGRPGEIQLHAPRTRDVDED